MWRVEAGRAGRYCDGISRRHFVQIGMTGLASLGLPDLLRAKSQSALGSSKQTSVILLWLDGGPSHMDLYDMKPLAPVEYRGIWRPIATKVPGMEITELFPRQAQVADKFSLIRSLHHGTGDHFTAGHIMLTGHGGVDGARNAGRNPSIGSMLAKLCGSRQPGLPAYIALPYAMSIGLRPGYFGGNYLGVQHNPFEAEGDPNQANFSVNNLALPAGFDLHRLDDRLHLHQTLDRIQRSADASGAFDSLDRFQQAAFELVSGEAARRAFDLSTESPQLRDRYGRNSWGQSTLLARRLVEAGSTFVTAHFGGWDHHWDLEVGMKNYLPQVDAAVATLLEDLSDRGLLDQVMVLVCGEFSRTPRMNDGSGMGKPGRDHWGNSMSCLIAGGGVRGGQVIGATDAKGEGPQERPVTPSDLHATIFHVLGADPHVAFHNHAGRPVPAIDRGEVIRELF